MNKTAIFTDKNDRVILLHNVPQSFSEMRREEAAIILDTDLIPEPQDRGENYHPTMYVRNGVIEYDYEYREPTDILNRLQ
jgi:hypothetical protein